MKKFIGHYVMHDASIMVYGVNGDKSSVEPMWHKGAFLVMSISMDGAWTHVYQNAVHETFEYAMRMFHGQFEPCFSAVSATSSARYHFAFDHAQWTMIAQHAGDMLCFMIPNLKAAYDKKGKKGKK